MQQQSPMIPAGGDRFQGHRTIFGGMQIDFKVVPQDTNGSLLILENTNHRKGGPPRHLHHDQDEWFYVLEGQYIIEIGDTTHHLGPGASLLAPRKIPHVWAHTGDSKGRLLVTFQPAGQMEGFFIAASQLMGPPSPEEMQALFRSHGMEVTGPPLSVE